jgi:hypothetical protein
MFLVTPHGPVQARRGGAPVGGPRSGSFTLSIVLPRTRRRIARVLSLFAGGRAQPRRRRAVLTNANVLQNFSGCRPPLLASVDILQIAHRCGGQSAAARRRRTHPRRAFARTPGISGTAPGLFRASARGKSPEKPGNAGVSRCVLESGLFRASRGALAPPPDGRRRVAERAAVIGGDAKCPAFASECLQRPTKAYGAHPLPLRRRRARPLVGAPCGGCLHSSGGC